MRSRYAALALSISFVGSLCLTISRADEIPALPVKPAETTILILPVIDSTGDRPEMQKEHTEFGNHRLEYEFITRDFKVAGPDLAVRSARNEDFDLDDSDSRTRANMLKLAKDNGADWVVSAEVIYVGSSNSHFGKRRATGKVRLRILDVKQNGWIADRYFEDHKDSQGFLGGSVGTTGLFRSALDTTLQRSTSNLLDQYPQTVKVFDEFGENDYLAGQTTIFVPNPGQQFNGLGNASTPVANVPAPSTSAQETPPAPVAPSRPVAAPSPAPAASAAPAATAPVTTQFTMNNGDVITGVIDHYDSGDDLYFIKVPTGMSLVQGKDVVSKKTVPTPPASAGDGSH